MRKKRFLALFFALVLVISLLAGCGKKSYEGTYKATYDMKDYLNSGLGGIMKVESCNIDFFLEIKDDTNYRLYTDEEQMKDSIVTALTEAMGGMMTEDDIRELLENDDSFSSMAISEEGKYKVDGDKLVFDPDSSDPQEATVDGDGNISMSVDMDNGTADLLFHKQ